MNRVLLQGARVITMAPGRPDVEELDVLIEDDKIAQIGLGLGADGADVVDFAGRILIPGLVNAHLHAWQAGLRCVGADWTLEEYLVHMHGGVARHCMPSDMKIAGLFGALSQINCGTTTVGDWCHNNPTPEHTDAAVEGLMQSGIRAVFMHGTPYTAPDAAYPVHEIDRLFHGALGRHELIGLGMAIRGPQYSTAEVAVADFRTAKDRNLVVSMHQSGGRPGASWKAVHDEGLISPRTNIVHGAGLTQDWIKLLVDAGASFTTTPENELGQGHCDPLTGQLLAMGSAPSLGTDVDSVVSGEILIAARMALAHQRGIDHGQHRSANNGMFAPKPTIKSKQALAWATVEGARAMGLQDRVGQIAPGMQADLVAIDARAINLWPAHDPIAAALQASIANIEAVMIGGVWRKRDHVLVDVNIQEVKERVLESGERLAHELNKSGLFANFRRQIVMRVVHSKLQKQMQA